MLSNEMIIKYQELVKKRFNREISQEQALDSGIRLLRLIELTYLPMSENELIGLQERRKETNH